MISKNHIKNYLIGVLLIIIILLLFFTIPEEKITTTTTTTEIKSEQTNHFFISDSIAKLKAFLTDSISSSIKPKLLIKYIEGTINADSIKNEVDAYWRNKIDSTKNYFYESLKDTSFVAKDSTGFTTDSLVIQSIFLSPYKLHPASLHTISAKLFSFDKIITTTVEKETIIVKKKLWDFLEPSIITGYGYGVSSKRFDYFIGVGIKVELF